MFLAVALLLIGFAGGWGWNGSIWSEKYAKLEGGHARDVAAGERLAREEETRRSEALEEARKNTQAELERHAADTASADSVAERLRAENARLRRAAENTEASCRSPAATSAVVVYSELLDRCDARAGDLAGEADRRRIAGLACEQAYDLLAE